jgi:hypothetical protein
VDIRPLSLHQPKQLHQNQKKACEQASKNGLGFLDGDHSLQLDASLVDRLPAPLRVYIGCGEVLYGDIDDADLVKIHLQSGKLCGSCDIPSQTLQSSTATPSISCNGLSETNSVDWPRSGTDLSKNSQPR